MMDGMTPITKNQLLKLWYGGENEKNVNRNKRYSTKA